MCIIPVPGTFCTQTFSSSNSFWGDQIVCFFVFFEEVDLSMWLRVLFMLLRVPTFQCYVRALCLLAWLTLVLAFFLIRLLVCAMHCCWYMYFSMYLKKLGKPTSRSWLAQAQSVHSAFVSAHGLFSHCMSTNLTSTMSSHVWPGLPLCRQHMFILQSECAEKCVVSLCISGCGTYLSMVTLVVHVPAQGPFQVLRENALLSCADLIHLPWMLLCAHTLISIHSKMKWMCREHDS